MPSGPGSLSGPSRDGGPVVRSRPSGAGQEVAPLVRPRHEKGRELIPILPKGPGTTARPSTAGHTDPEAFWKKYYNTKDEKKLEPNRLRDTVALLNLSGKTRDVQAALWAYLELHSERSEPWMYEALALAIDMNHGSPEQIKTCLNFAADVAQRTHNPNFLVSVAGQMLYRGQLERVGALLDETMERVPHRFEPMLMSVELAERTSDPRRMGDTIDRMLALGWPGRDELLRAEVSNHAHKLARALREEDRGKEAGAMLGRLRDAQTRDLYVRLTWDGYADFDLAVDEPLGATSNLRTPRTVFGGSLIQNGYGAHPEEIYVCPRGFDGDYTIHISNIWVDPKKPTTRLTLETIVHEGTAREEKKLYRLNTAKLDGTWVVHLAEGRRRRVLPYIDTAAEFEKAFREEMRKRQKPSASKSSAKKPGANR